ncbi:right-handed parallel beta-helix repeat-containing protein [Kibdelosporangium philippinense]|uniref:Right-handed parallel beta-helix repeat-containing protein n=1 Tax=Kibdelosporangium philippinense TaxID=211113 RepID=A0ABS8Z574_9PSEU|nr:right-handed parallel beta-helix repeat-containing protein [Kibdelosporangium philippinense]MCE7002642.1 right-handed parallel beta-helix repeat-containing protein [Kibdelosporangium philippinense]
MARGLTGVTIEDIVIDTAGDGIVLENCHNVTIARVTVNTCDGDGIRVIDSSGIAIIDCVIYGYDTGSCADGTFRCRTAWPRGGINVIGSRDVTVSTVVFEHCRGLLLDTVDDVSVCGVSMTDICGDPLTLRGRGRRLDLSEIDVRNVMSGPRAVKPDAVAAERPGQGA